jgi:hypothetical protein
MNGFHPTLSAAVANEHRNDLLRHAARSRMIADLPDRDRHQTPRHRAAWWSRVTAFVAHRAVTTSA